MIQSTKEGEALYGVDGWVLASQIAKRALPICRRLEGDLQVFTNSIANENPLRLASAANMQEREFLGYTGDIAEVAHIVCVLIEMCYRLWESKREVGESTEEEDFLFADESPGY
eukprot:1893568-Rhodomonas_salina.1